MPMRPMVRPNYTHVFLLFILSSGFGGRYVMDDANVPVCELYLNLHVSDDVFAL
jgi:hypothetical protein